MFVLIISILQGKVARTPFQSLIAGLVTGLVGYLILMCIIIGISYMIIQSSAMLIGQSIGIFFGLMLPCGIIGALSAFFSNKWIFPEGVEGTGEKLTPADKPMLTLKCLKCNQMFDVVQQERPFRIKCKYCGIEGIIR